MCLDNPKNELDKDFSHLNKTKIKCQNAKQSTVWLCGRFYKVPDPSLKWLAFFPNSSKTGLRSLWPSSFLKKNWVELEVTKCCTNKNNKKSSIQKFTLLVVHATCWRERAGQSKSNTFCLTKLKYSNWKRNVKILKNKPSKSCICYINNFLVKKFWDNEKKTLPCLLWEESRM